MTREEALALQKRGLRDWIAMLGTASAGARVHEADGVTAALVPVCPERSICNSVTYDDAAALTLALAELAAAYDAAGIRAWTVWVPEFDRDAIDVLEAAGHKLDGEPMAMSLALAAFDPPQVGDLDWDNEPEPGEIGELNELAYGLPAGSGFADGLADLGRAALYRARSEGETACVLATIDHGSDLGFYFVATHPGHRGRGLASRLMTVALLDARERGLETSSLQGSPMGQPIYGKLGYSADFKVRMYERRAG